MSWQEASDKLHDMAKELGGVIQADGSFARTDGSAFELGDCAVVMGYDYYTTHRRPKLEGTVTARGKNCVRLRYKPWYSPWTREKWFPAHHATHHVEKIQTL